ncbi:MAG: hypothetical protein WDN24_14180 [Sphingomonas sp.]
MKYPKLMTAAAIAASMIATPVLGQSASGKPTATRAASVLPAPASSRLRTPTKLRHRSDMTGSTVLVALFAMAAIIKGATTAINKSDG